jgi:lipopolysaccharide export LptBFGC system permease protein LptF
LRNKKEDMNDPFAEYDKFWDKLDEAEEIKEDEDYFKERSVYKNQTYKKSKRNQMNKKTASKVSSSFLFIIFGFSILSMSMGRTNMGRIISSLSSFLVFGFVMFIIVSILSKSKNQ